MVWDSRRSGTRSKPLELDSSGKLVWLDRRAGGQETLRLTDEPSAGFMRRSWFGFLSILPVEWEL